MTRCLKATSLLMGIVSYFVFSKVSLAEPVKTNTLSIKLVATDQQQDTLEADDIWSAACQTLGQSLKNGSGPWGLGVFGSFKCDVENVPETKVSPNSSHSMPPTSASEVDRGLVADAEWTLLVRPGPDSTVLELYYAGMPLGLASTRYRSTNLALRVLRHRELTAVLAAHLLDQLPFMGVITSTNFKSDRQEITSKQGKQDPKLPPPPKTLMLYKLTFEKTRQVWLAELVSTANLTASATPTDPRFVWKLNSKVNLDDNYDPSSSEPIWIHSATGRRSQSQLLAKEIESVTMRINERESTKLKRLQYALSVSVSEGFTGLRFGHSIFTGQLVRKITLFSALIELRGSPLDGLRGYYDLWPKVTEGANKGAIGLSGSRAVLGWSFTRKIKAFFDRLDLSPKIGRWSMNLLFKRPSSTAENQLLDFSVPGALSLGIEAGIEKSIRKSLFRLWAAGDTSAGVIIRGQSANVSTTRAGIDGLISGSALTNDPTGARISFLAFALYERIKLARPESAETSKDVAINSVNFTIAYAGGGVVLSW